MNMLNELHVLKGSIMKKVNTGKHLGVRWDWMGWRFERTIWQEVTFDGYGREFIVVNGCAFYLSEVIAACDDWYIV